MDLMGSFQYDVGLYNILQKPNLALKTIEGPQFYNIRDPNDPWNFWLILTPAKKKISSFSYNSYKV